MLCWIVQSAKWMRECVFIEPMYLYRLKCYKHEVLICCKCWSFFGVLVTWFHIFIPQRRQDMLTVFKLQFKVDSNNHNLITSLSTTTIKPHFNSQKNECKLGPLCLWPVFWDCVLGPLRNWLHEEKSLLRTDILDERWSKCPVMLNFETTIFSRSLHVFFFLFCLYLSLFVFKKLLWNLMNLINTDKKWNICVLKVTFIHVFVVKSNAVSEQNDNIPKYITVVCSTSSSKNLRWRQNSRNVTDCTDTPPNKSSLISSH